MTWLMTQMWMFLAAAGILAFLFGLALRGLMLRGRVRRAEVDAELRATELAQLKQENDDLYQAQAKLRATAQHGGSETMHADSGADAELTAKLADREAALARLESQVRSLEAQLAEKGDETSGALTGAAAAVAGAVGGAALAGGDDEELKAENEALTARVSALEAELDAARTASADAPAAAAASTVEAEKLAWQNDYLRTRLKVFEQKAGVQLTGDLPDTEADLPPADVGIDGPELEARETPDEELARLRWRNRYLEGRLAYLEEERDESGGAAPAAAAMGAAGLAGAAMATALGDDDGQGVADAPADAQAAVDVDVPPVFEPAAEDADIAPEPEPVAELVPPAPEPAPEPAAEDTPAEPAPEPAPQPEEVAEAGDGVEDVSAAIAQIARDTETTGEPNISGQIEAARATPDLELPETPVDAPAEAAIDDGVGTPPETEAAVSDTTPEPAPDSDTQPETLDATRPHALAAARDGDGDDLTRIDGVGPRIQDVLNAMGVFHFDQIAAWSPENVAWVDDYLSFGGRVAAQDWVGQAASLAQSATQSV